MRGRFVDLFDAKKQQNDSTSRHNQSPECHVVISRYYSCFEKDQCLSNKNSNPFNAQKSSSILNGYCEYIKIQVIYYDILIYKIF